MRKVFVFLFLSLILLPNQVLFAQEEAKTGQFTKMQFYSPQLSKEWNYTVYLPPGYYDNPNRVYPIVYLLHGMYNNYNTFNSKNFSKLFNKMIKKREMPETIFVCPDGFGYSWWVNSAVYGNVENAVIQDLIPMVEKTYRVNKTRGKRAIAGISMGGYGALRYALLYPQLFYSSILLSPAVFYPLPGDEVFYSGSQPANWYYNFVVRETRGRGVFGKPFDSIYYLSLNYRRLYKTYTRRKVPVNFYVLYGNKDPVTDNATKNMIAYFRSNRHPLQIIEISGEHDWNTWKKAFRQVLTEAIFAPDEQKN